MGLITGFIEGSVTYDNSGTAVLLPFQDSIQEAEFSYEGELLFSETFSAKGIKGAKSACFHKEMAKFMMKTEDISWAFLQAAAAQRDEARSLPIPVTESLVLTGTTALTATLSAAPVVGTSVIAADGDGRQYSVSFTGTTATVTAAPSGPAPTAGLKVTFRYQRAAANERSIELGRREKIKEVSVYGRFYGCPDELLIIANRAVIVPKLTPSAGDKPGEASMELTCLRDDFGTFASIIRL